MKQTILFILLISNLAFAEDCDWQWSNPQPQGNELYSVEFANKDIIYIAGDAGTILKSCDGGNQWELLNSGTTENLWYMSVLDSKNVYIAGEFSLLLKTTDGGKTWLHKSFPEGDSIFFPIIHFKNKDIGYVLLSDNKHLLKTIDGGENWNILFASKYNKINHFFFINENVGFLTYCDTLLKTTDGGLNWIKINNIPFVNNSKYYKIFFYNDSIGWLNSTNGILKTTDAGENWSYINEFSDYIKYYRFFDENTGYIFGNKFLYKTTDGGSNWDPQFSGDSFDKDIFSIDIFSDGFLIGVGSNGAIKMTTDFGYNWINIRNGLLNSIYDIQFIDTELGWAVGLNGTLLKTTDSGKKWQNMNNASFSRSIGTVQFFNSEIGIITEKEGAVFKTTNAGIDWVKLNEMHDLSFQDVFFINEQIGWIGLWSWIGEYYIMKTTDGGSYWSYQKALRDTSINEIQFLNENIGYAVGNHSSGLFFKTEDGGKNWSINEIDPNKYIISLCFINQNTGWLVGNSGFIVKTTDGGGNWIYQNVSPDFDFNKVVFIDENNGWIISTYSNKIFTTTNGGLNWKIDNIKTNNLIRSIYFIDNKYGWIIGDAGTILKYSCTETSIEVHLPISEHIDFQIFPNPTTNEITLSIPENENINTISIFNSLGMEVKRIEQTEILGQNKITISIENLPVGLYHCSFVNQAGRVTKSFVVVR